MYSKEKIDELAAKIFVDEPSRVFANEVFEEASKYKLYDDVLALARFINADIGNAEIENLLKEAFGNSFIENLRLLHRISKVSIPETQKRIADLRKIFIDITSDLRIIILKVIERYISLKTASINKDKNVISLAEECLYLYAPIAHRLGISRLYTPIEEYAFKHLFPDDFKKIHRAIELRRESLERKLMTMSRNVSDSLKKHNINAEIKHRVKKPYSIYRKLKNQNTTLDGIYDLMALRVILDKEEDCYLTLGIVHSKWVPIEKRFRDWITFPKPNGYRSIQTTVHTTGGDKFEIQIRTHQMDLEAEYGSSAHWAYKENSQGKSDMWVKKLKDFLENDEYFDNPVELFNALKSEMKSDYIHVLTPKGQIVSLVEHATAIDFAFAVHTNLGYKAIGARINGRFAKLKTELNSGDVVDIITSNNGKPSRDWLDIVKSSRSRSKILRWFKNNEKDLMIADGKKSWERLKKTYKSKLKSNDDEAVFRENIAVLGFATPEEFYWSIANGNTKCTLTLLKKVYPKAFEKTKQLEAAADAKIKLKKLSPQIKVEGLGGIETKIAKCCYPIKGESIVAYVTRRSEIKIHRSNCPYIKSASDPANIKPAEWINKTSLQSVRLRIYGTDFSKMLASFAKEAADNSLLVLHTEMQSAGKKGVSLHVEIQVEDVEQLKKFTSKLKRLQGIDGVKIL